MLSVVAALVLSQYVRSHVVRDDPTSQCLWWPEGTVVFFEQSAPGNPETPGDTEFSAVAASFATWNRQLELCGSLRIKELDRSQSRAITSDRKTLVLFRQVDCDELEPACPNPTDCGDERDCWEHANGALAITTTRFDKETGRISDSDVELNTPRFIFTAVESPVCIAPTFNVDCIASDIQNTVTHEVGHVLGLGHSTDPDSTMNANAFPGETGKRSLDADSRQFICDVYPVNQPSKRCLLPAYDGALGRAANNCSAVPGAAWAFVGLLLLRAARSGRR